MSPSTLPLLLTSLFSSTKHHSSHIGCFGVALHACLMYACQHRMHVITSEIGDDAYVEAVVMLEGEHVKVMDTKL